MKSSSRESKWQRSALLALVALLSVQGALAHLPGYE